MATITRMLTAMFVLTAFAAAAPAANVTGTWELSVEMSAGSGTPLLDLKQQGEQLTGTLHSIAGEVAVKGFVIGDRIEFGGTADASGIVVKITYKGTIQSATAMKGKASYEGFDDNATWTATKKN